ncbi:MAG: DNAJC11 domain-containing protein [Acidovorax sp.]
MTTHSVWLRCWAALLLLVGLMAPAMAQRGGDDGAYQILSARYGTPEGNVDVTNRLRDLARLDVTIRVSNDTFGVDPHRDRPKVLRIYARDPRGGNRTFEYPEGSFVDGRQFTAWSNGSWGQGSGGGNWNGHPGNGRPDDGEFIILQAMYGTPEYHVDVTNRLRDLARRDSAIQLTNDTFGVDPHRGQRKTLRIHVRTRDGQTRMFEYPEGSTIDGARFSGWGGGNWGNEGWNGGWAGSGGGSYPQPGMGGGLEIVQAIYGADNRTVDMTSRLRSQVRGDRLSVRVENDLAGYDPAPGTPKTLWVTYRLNGREYRVNVRESDYLRLP